MTLSRQDIQWAAGAYGSDPGVLAEIDRLEGNGLNDYDSNWDRGTPSNGEFQFIQPTFDAYARQARQANPEAWRGVPMRWLNPRAQALATSWAIANGKGKAWTTYGRALKAAGRLPAAPGPRGRSDERSVRAQRGGGAAGDPILAGILTQGGIDPLVASLITAEEGAPAQVARNRGMQDSFFAARKGKTLPSLLAFAKRYGATVTSTTGGRHAPGSFHYSRRAIDTSPNPQMAAYAKAHPGEFAEFYGPHNWHIEDGRLVSGAFPDHGDHQHVARRI